MTDVGSFWPLLVTSEEQKAFFIIIIIIFSLCSPFKSSCAHTHNICPRTKSCATGIFFYFIYHFIIIIGRSSFFCSLIDESRTLVSSALSLNFLFFFCRGLDRPVPRHYHWSGAEVSQTLFIFIIKFSFNLSIELEITVAYILKLTKGCCTHTHTE